MELTTATPLELKRLFEPVEESAQYSLKVSEIRYGDIEKRGVTIPFFFDQKFDIVFVLDEVITESIFSLTENAQLIGENGSFELTLLFTTRSENANGTNIIRATPNRSPCLVKRKSEQTTSLQIALINGPKFLQHSNEILLSGNDPKVVLRAYGNSPSSLESPYFGSLKLDGKFTPETVLSDLDYIRNCFSFLRGTSCGFGNIVGFDEAGGVNFIYFGFGRRDELPAQDGWYDINIQKDLPLIFQGFSDAFDCPSKAIALAQTVSFYRNSNLTRRFSSETAIITSVAALEAITNYVLEFEAGWSRSLLKSKVGLADKVRAAMSFCRHDVSFFENLTEVEEYSKQNNFDDAFSAVIGVRNRLVHQDTKSKISGVALHESWCLSQFIVELFVLFLINYRGQMVDRRNYQRWRGATIEVPFKS